MPQMQKKDKLSASVNGTSCMVGDNPLSCNIDAAIP